MKLSNSFWQYNADYWFHQLNSSVSGLSNAEASERLLKAGNLVKLDSPFKKDLKLLIRQYKSPLMLLLIGAVVLSAFLGDTSDVYIILFILLSTGLLSFYQERNASRVVEKLQSLIALKSMVLRSGEAVELISNQIVSGDILLLKAGDMIPADCLLIESNELHANEASLTGESYPVKKECCVLDANTELPKRRNSLWQGTNIASGSAKAIVIQTGNNTIFSSITQSASSVIETSFEKGIRDFGYFLMRITLVLSFFILIVNLVNHKPVIDSALFALALAIGMAPELLPAITTIAMSAGAKRMLGKKVIVKKLSSIQNLGEVNLLCTDKTGTITEGEIEVAAVLNGLDAEDAYARELVYWNAFYEGGFTNPMDEALKRMAFQPKLKAEKVGEVPFDFIRKRLSIAIKTDNETLLISKGAVNEVFGICDKIRLSDGTVADIQEYQSTVQQNYVKYGNAGLRSVAVAYKNIVGESITKEDEKEMIFAGFVLLKDPVKKGIFETIDALRKLQVDLKIITGDNKNISRTTALEIGVQNPVIITGEELLDTSPEALLALVEKVHIFAEVEPQQKERIILALRKKYTVAYMGDGINDVAAINAADVGISVENAVDVAREAADFVLMEKELLVLADGIREGRKTFANTLKYIYINTGATFGNMCSVAVASLTLPFLPMLPLQILMTNFLTDFPYLSVASDNVDEEQIKTPGRWNFKLIKSYMLIFGIHSSLFDLATFCVLFFGLKQQASSFQTSWFIESVLTELFILFIIRTHKNFVRSRPSMLLFALSMLGFIITLLLPYLPFAQDMGFVPLPFTAIAAVLIIVLLYVITADLLKIWFFKKFDKA